MSVLDVDSNIESIDDNIRRAEAEKNLKLLIECYNKEIAKSINKEIFKTLFELGNDNNKIQTKRS